MTLQFCCFGDVTVYVIPKNQKLNKYCVDRGKSGSPGIIKTYMYICMHQFACKIVTQKKKKKKEKEEKRSPNFNSCH